MNSEQLQDWLTAVSDDLRLFDDKTTSKTPKYYAQRLAEHAESTCVLINYLTNNYENVQCIQPIIAQLLSIYYKQSAGRVFVLQIVPSLLNTYLLGIAKHQKQSISMLETFFQALYNEEILAGGPGSDQMTKRVEEVRIPSVRYPSVYHDPTRLLASATDNMADLRRNGIASVCSVIRIGPYPAVERIRAENRPIVLTRVLKAVNSMLSYMCRDIVCRTYCLSMLIIAKSGFSFPESDLRIKVLHHRASNEYFGDHSKKPRIPIANYLLIEALEGVHFSLFNGYPDIALRALDAIHFRGQYEMFADVQLVTNALRKSVQNAETIKLILDIEPQLNLYDSPRPSRTVTPTPTPPPPPTIVTEEPSHPSPTTSTSTAVVLAHN